MQSVLHESESAFEQMELYIAMISFVPKCHYRRIIEIIIESLFVPNLEINQNFTLGTSSVPIIDQDPCNAIVHERISYSRDLTSRTVITDTAYILVQKFLENLASVSRKLARLKNV